MAAAESSKRTIWRSATAGGRCAAWRRATGRKRQRTRVHATSTTCGGDSRAGASLHACAVGATISGWRPLLRSAIPHGPGGCASASPTRGRRTPTGSGPPTPRRWSLQPLDASSTPVHTGTPNVRMVPVRAVRPCCWPAAARCTPTTWTSIATSRPRHPGRAGRGPALHQALPAFARA